MSVKFTADGDRVRVKSDRAGERAVSDTISRDELVAALGALGFSVTPAADPATDTPPDAPTSPEAPAETPETPETPAAPGDGTSEPQTDAAPPA